MSLPWRSSAFALFRTSNAVSVPGRDMRLARRSWCWVAFSMVANPGIIPSQAAGLADRANYLPQSARRRGGRSQGFVTCATTWFWGSFREQASRLLRNGVLLALGTQDPIH